MCLAYFVGRGYSGRFSAHMGEVLSVLGPDTPVRLTVSCDRVCDACPNRRGGRCEKEELVAGYDRAVLDLCGLEEGQCLPFGLFAALVQGEVLAPGRRASVCGGCQWEDICRSQPSRWARPPWSGQQTHFFIDRRC